MKYLIIVLLFSFVGCSTTKKESKMEIEQLFQEIEMELKELRKKYNVTYHSGSDGYKRKG
jgi:hypothetical protein